MPIILLLVFLVDGLLDGVIVDFDAGRCKPQVGQNLKLFDTSFSQ